MNAKEVFNFAVQLVLNRPIFNRSNKTTKQNDPTWSALQRDVVATPGFGSLTLSTAVQHLVAQIQIFWFRRSLTVSSL